jgi:manganese-dependent inorganic pyrophosphatase
MKIYVIGHTGPDLDSIASAVGYAEFLKKSGRYERAEIVPVRSGEPNRETVFAFDKFGVEIPQPVSEIKVSQEDAVVLVDHNEETQRDPLIQTGQVVEIVDHHKLNINFTTPVRVDTKPVGSTSTIVYEYFKMYGVDPSEKILSLLLLAILSDTVGLKGPTTTGIDATYAHEIAKKTGLDIEKLTFELFKAKSDLKGLTPEEIVNKDYKVFSFGDKEVFIGQVETVEPEAVLKNRENLVEALENVKVTRNVSIAFLFVTDILKLNSYALYSTEEEKSILEKAFTAVGDGGVVEVGPKISRKKDIAPAIESTITQKRY